MREDCYAILGCIPLGLELKRSDGCLSEEASTRCTMRRKAKGSCNEIAGSETLTWHGMHGSSSAGMIMSAAQHKCAVNRPSLAYHVLPSEPKMLTRLRSLIRVTSMVLLTGFLEFFLPYPPSQCIHIATSSPIVETIPV